MLELLIPFRDLDRPIPCNFVPRFLTKERLKLCWEQVSQIRGLLPHSCAQREPNAKSPGPARLASPAEQEVMSSRLAAAAARTHTRTHARTRTRAHSSIAPGHIQQPVLATERTAGRTRRT